MMRSVRIIVVGVVLATSAPAWAAIPEPDVILYGNALVNGLPAVQRDSVVLIARLGSGQEVGRFDFGDCNADGVRDNCELSCQASGCIGVAGCGTARDTNPADGLLDDCPGNFYALRIKCESTPTGITPTGLAAVLNPANPTVVRITMALAGGPEKLVRHLVISERGRIRQMALSVLDLLAHRNASVCMSGPGGASPGGACTTELFNAADYDDDGDADLRDHAFMQLHFVGD